MDTLWYKLRDDARSDLILSKIQSANLQFKHQRDLRNFLKIKRGLTLSSQLNCSSANFPSDVWCKEIVQDFKTDLRFQSTAI